MVHILNERSSLIEFSNPSTPFDFLHISKPLLVKGVTLTAPSHVNPIGLFPINIYMVVRKLTLTAPSFVTPIDPLHICAYVYGNESINPHSTKPFELYWPALHWHLHVSCMVMRELTLTALTHVHSIYMPMIISGLTHLEALLASCGHPYETVSAGFSDGKKIL